MNTQKIKDNMKPIYLDHNSTTPMDKRVIKVMEPFYSNYFGNPSSAHLMGVEAKEAIEKAREQVASIINAKSGDIYFTNSATEANNIILKGYKYYTIITSNTEHSSIINCLKAINKDKNYKSQCPIELEEIKVDNDGNLNYNDLEQILKDYDEDHPILVSIIAANNEIGTIHNLYKIGALCKKYNAKFHTDAAQAIGKVDIDVDAMNIFALTLSGHKICGPKGVGCLYIRDESLVEPLTHGGYQNTFISGTQNVPAIVGLGMACEILQLPENKIENGRVEQLRDLLLALLKKGIPDIIVNGTMESRLTNNLNVGIKGIQTEVLVKGIDDVIIISGGSACTSGSIEPSHVITALGAPYPDCTFRMGLGRWTTEEEIYYAAKRIIETVNSIRESSSA